MSASFRASLVLTLFACLVMLPLTSAHAKGRPSGGGAGVALTHEAVVPGPGEMSASGNAIISAGHGTVCFTITLSGLSDKVVEIALYKGAVGQMGTKVLRLTPSPIGLYQLNDCVPADNTLLRDLGRNASDYYVQVNTQLYSNGALRGQLH